MELVSKERNMKCNSEHVMLHEFYPKLHRNVTFLKDYNRFYTKMNILLRLINVATLILLYENIIEKMQTSAMCSLAEKVSWEKCNKLP